MPKYVYDVIGKCSFIIMSLLQVCVFIRHDVISVEGGVNDFVKTVLRLEYIKARQEGRGSKKCVTLFIGPNKSHFFKFVL